MKDTPDAVSTFFRFIQLKSLRERTKESYLVWRAHSKLEATVVYLHLTTVSENKTRAALARLSAEAMPAPRA